MTEKPIPEADSKYLMINASTRRARDLARGAKPTIPYAEGNMDYLDVAMEEIAAGKVLIRRRNELTGEVEEFEEYD